LALAFLFWAANLICSDRGLARLFNDVAIATFVVDGLLVIFGWPSAPDHGEGRAAHGAEPALATSGTESRSATVAERA
jgi:hypothetical protein